MIIRFLRRERKTGGATRAKREACKKRKTLLANLDVKSRESKERSVDGKIR